MYFEASIFTSLLLCYWNLSTLTPVVSTGMACEGVRGLSQCRSDSQIDQLLYVLCDMCYFLKFYSKDLTKGVCDRGRIKPPAFQISYRRIWNIHCVAVSWTENRFCSSLLDSSSLRRKQRQNPYSTKTFDFKELNEIFPTISQSIYFGLISVNIFINCL